MKYINEITSNNFSINIKHFNDGIELIFNYDELSESKFLSNKEVMFFNNQNKNIVDEYGNYYFDYLRKKLEAKKFNELFESKNINKKYDYEHPCNENDYINNMLYDYKNNINEDIEEFNVYMNYCHKDLFGNFIIFNKDTKFNDSYLNNDSIIRFGDYIENHGNKQYKFNIFIENNSDIDNDKVIMTDSNNKNIISFTLHRNK